jgi:hypothetical protein
LLPGEGQTYSLTNFRGEEVTINARGVYHWDTVSSTAQMQPLILARRRGLESAVAFHWIQDAARFLAGF